MFIVKGLRYVICRTSYISRVRSVVAKWLAHWPLVLEVMGLIPAAGEEKIWVSEHAFFKCHLQG